MKQYGAAVREQRYQHSTAAYLFNLRVKIGAEDTDEYDIVSVYGKDIFLPAGKCLFLHISEYQNLSVTIYLTDKFFLSGRCLCIKKSYFFLTGLIALSISAIPALADPQLMMVSTSGG